MSRILLVEDERHLAEGLAFNLRNAGYPVEIVESGEEALETIGDADGAFDLVILDVMLPGVDGVEVTRRLRRNGFTRPILMISARDRTADAIQGLDAGADDYITKPYDLDEVMARIRGALRRQIWTGRPKAPEPETPRTLRFGRWTIDFQTFQARSGDEVEELSPKEIGILELFAARPEEVIRRETFLEKVWELPGTIESRTVDNFIRRLRQTLEEKPSSPKHILSVRGAGYRFVP